MDRYYILQGLGKCLQWSANSDIEAVTKAFSFMLGRAINVYPSSNGKNKDIVTVVALDTKEVSCFRIEV